MWCCAGSSHPTLFIDTPISEFATQMNNNYFSSMYMAHAIVKRWVQPSAKKPGSPSTGSSEKSSGAAPLPRHLIFTASFMSFYSFAGYASYSPAKAALRSLSDTLSSEMNLYSAAHPREPRVRLHTIFPAGILSEGYEAENRVKSDLTKHLEEGDKPETPEVIAARSIKGLESGLELITTDFQTGLVRCSMLGGSVRGGFMRGLGDWFLASIVAIVMVFVRGDHDKKVRNWGIKYGTSGSRGENTSA
jgi:3-dehydrosphinganine reductase